MVLAQTILHLCVNDTYEKYMKMMVGLITAIILLVPIISLIKEGGSNDFESYLNQYETEMFGEKPDFEAIKENAWTNYLESEENGF